MTVVGPTMVGGGDDNFMAADEFLQQDRQLFAADVREITALVRRRAPICSRKFALQACTSFALVLGGLALSGHRLHEYEEARRAEAREAVAKLGAQAIASFERVFETAATSTMTLAALVQQDQGEALLGRAVMEDLAKALPRDVEGLTTSVGGLQAASLKEVNVSDIKVGTAAWPDDLPAEAAGTVGDLPPELLELLKAHAEGSTGPDGIVVIIDPTAKAPPPDGTRDPFESEALNKFGPQFLAAHAGLASVQLAPNGVVRSTCCDNVSGLTGMRGIDLFTDPFFSTALKEALAAGGEHWHLAALGPRPSTARKTPALFVHCPVFIKATATARFIGVVKDHPTYWGSIIVEVEIDAMVKKSLLQRLPEQGYGYALLGSAPGAELWASSAADWKHFARAHDPVELTFQPKGMNGHVRLLLWPSMGWKAYSELFAVQVVLIGVFFLLSLASFYTGLLRHTVLQRITAIVKRFKKAHYDLAQRYSVPV